MFRYSLRSLFIVMTMAGVLSYVGYLVTRPFYVIRRIDCGDGRRVELLGDNGFCDKGSSVHYRFSGMKDSDSPPSFAMWGCGADPPVTVLTAEEGNLVGIAAGEPVDELAILVDFKTGAYWPRSWERRLDDNVLNMLNRLRRARGELWLSHTYDGDLTKPRDGKK